MLESTHSVAGQWTEQPGESSSSHGLWRVGALKRAAAGVCGVASVEGRGIGWEAREVKEVLESRERERGKRKKR